MSILWSRRHLLNCAGATAALLAAHPGLMAASTQTAGCARDFDARNAMRFIDLPDLKQVGLKPVTVVYASELWPKQADRREPDSHFVETVAAPRLRPKVTDLAVIDVEHWDLAGISPVDIDRNTRRYVALLTALRKSFPGVKLGLYGTIPVRDYWTPVKGSPSRLQAWRHDNRRLQPIADVVDVVFPSLYAFYDDADGWITYAQANMDEAKAYGKPVYPFLWPQYHGSRDQIAPDFWRVQLETVFENADGMVIWTPAKGKPRWNPEAPWWRETVDFLRTAGLAEE